MRIKTNFWTHSMTDAGSKHVGSNIGSIFEQGSFQAEESETGFVLVGEKATVTYDALQNSLCVDTQDGYIMAADF